MKILFDSNDLYDVEDIDIIIDELAYVLQTNTRKPRGEVQGFLFKSQRSSRYGSICNNGQTGFSKKMIPNLLKAILSIESDSVVVWDNDGELLVSYHDHDGSHNCTIYPITKSKADRFANASYQQLNKLSENLVPVKTK